MDESVVNSTEMHTIQELKHRLESLQQENVVLKSEIETFKLRIRNLEDSNAELRQNSVNIQVRAEQEEEFISNKLMKKITELKKEKETLAINYEQEEEFLTNDLIRKMHQIREEKAYLEDTLEKEQKAQISKLTCRIQKLENDVTAKQKNLDTLRHEKIELENALEQEQEGLVNRLWKKMEKLEAEKLTLKTRLETENSKEKQDTESTHKQLQGKSKKCEKLNSNDEAGSLSGQQKRMKQHQEPMKIDELSRDQTDENQHDISNNAIMHVNDERMERLSGNATSQAEHVHSCILQLSEEVARLRKELSKKKDDCRGMSGEEKTLQDENRRLRRHLQAEIERRQEMCRNMSESESSLEIDEERQFNERRKYPSHGLCSVPTQVSPNTTCQLIDHQYNVVSLLHPNVSSPHGSVNQQKLRVRTTSESTGALLQQSFHPVFPASSNKLMNTTPHNIYTNNSSSSQSHYHQYHLHHTFPSQQYHNISSPSSIIMPAITTNPNDTIGDENDFNQNGQK